MGSDIDEGDLSLSVACGPVCSALILPLPLVADGKGTGPLTHSCAQRQSDLCITSCWYDSVAVGGRGSFVCRFIGLSNSRTCSHIGICLPSALNSVKQMSFSPLFDLSWIRANSEVYTAAPQAGFGLTNTSTKKDTHTYISAEICELLRLQDTGSVHHASLQLLRGCVLVKGWAPKVSRGTEIIDREAWKEERRECSMGEREKDSGDNTEREKKPERGWRECLKEINSLFWTAVERKGVAGVAERERKRAR